MQLPVVLALSMALSLVTASCDQAAPSGDGAPGSAGIVAPVGPSGAGVPQLPVGSPIHSDADCRKAPVCKDFGACTHQGGKCAVTSDADCGASTFCKMAGKCVAYQGQCRIGAAEDGDCNKPHGASAVNPCATKGHCTAKDGVCLAGKDEDCAKTQACREAGLCTAADGHCVVGSEEDCRQSLGCAKAKACEFRRLKDSGGAVCAPPASSAKAHDHAH